VIPVPKDRRSLFVVPWIKNEDGSYKYTYIGTTDTTYKGPVDNPQCTKEDIAYVLNALNASVTTNVTEADVLGVWSGLRPLVKTNDESKKGARTADLSRRHSVVTSQSGVVTVTGGKLTTFREMAEDAVDAALELLKRNDKCRTKRLPIRGSVGQRRKGTYLEQHLDGRYGSDAAAVRALIDKDSSLGEPLIPGLPYLRAEAVYAVTTEMATTLDDILSRRTRALLQDREATSRASRDIATLVAPYLGWSETDISANVAQFADVVAQEVAASKVTEQEFIAAHQ